MITIEMFADLSCPFAYVVHARWRGPQEEHAGSVELVHRSLALEYVNRQPTPKITLDAELTILLLEEPEIPWTPWQVPESEWPVTIWPAFEAVKCAELQGAQAADDLAWAIRHAFFANCRCISMRHVLLDLASETGLDTARFEADFDGGVVKRMVIDEARQGWEVLRVPGSPSWVLPAGDHITDFGLPDLDVDGRGRPVLLNPASCHGQDCIDRMRQILDGALNGPVSSLEGSQ